MSSRLIDTRVSSSEERSVAEIQIWDSRANGFLKIGLNEIAKGATIEKGQSPRTLQTSEVRDEKSVRD